MNSFSINAGNKIDLADKREVSQQRAAEFSEAQDMYYLETSAKESDNVEKLFLDLACRLISEARQNTLENNVSSPLPGEGKSISYLTCCNFNWGAGRGFPVLPWAKRVCLFSFFFFLRWDLSAWREFLPLPKSGCRPGSMAPAGWQHSRIYHGWSFTFLAASGAG